jgi:hypothetical protein
MKALPISLAALALVFAVHAAPAQIWIGVEAGGSRTVGDDYDEWEWGVSAGADIWAQGNRFIWLGGRAGFSRWPSPRESEFLSLVDSLITGEASGTGYVVEFVPMVRLNSGLEQSVFNLFIEGGPGLYILDNEVEVEGTINGTDFSASFGEENVARLGLSAGGGVSLTLLSRIMLEAFPLIHVVFGNDESFTYLTLNLGVSLGL